MRNAVAFVSRFSPQVVSSKLVLSNVTVEACAGFWGGALFASQSKVRLERSRLIDNRADADRSLGGQWVGAGFYPNIWDGSWNPGSGVGGGALLLNSVAELIDVVLVGNVATTGGAALAVVSNLPYIECRFAKPRCRFTVLGSHARLAKTHRVENKNT